MSLPKRVMQRLSQPMITGRLGAAENKLQDARFYVEPVVAWRAWRMTEEPEPKGLRLRSVSYKVRWPVRKPMRAHCWPLIQGFTLPKFPHNQAPHIEHGCGIYAVKEPEQAEEWQYDYQNHTVIGQVKLWGTVYEFTEGYLAEYAYPLSLVATEAMCEQMAHRYAVNLV